jgi:hypothetical protein
LLLLDHGASQVTGAVTTNTLPANPNPSIVENIKVGNDVTGTVTVKSNRIFDISGYVVTSAGTVTTSISQAINFSSKQRFKLTDSVYSQNITQSTTTQSWTTQADSSGIQSSYDRQDYPLSVNYFYGVNPDGTSAQTVPIRQEYHDQSTVEKNGKVIASTNTDDTVNNVDTLLIDASGNLTGNQGQAGSQQYLFNNLFSCYDVNLTAANNLLTGVTKGCN